jgi:hypothetical protein
MCPGSICFYDKDTFDADECIFCYRNGNIYLFFTCFLIIYILTRQMLE